MKQLKVELKNLCEEIRDLRDQYISISLLKYFLLIIMIDFQINPIIVPPKPETEFAAVVINITTIHTKDLDDNMDAFMQLKQYPNQSVENISRSIVKKFIPEKSKSIFIDIANTTPAITVNERLIFCRVLEDVLS